MAMGLSTKALLLAALASPAGSISIVTTERWKHLGQLQPSALTSSTPQFRQKLQNRNDVQYFSSIKLGGQHVDAIFDTGSFDILVVSQKCMQCPHPQYNSSSSKTYHSLHAEANHTFGSGETTSHLGKDDFRVGPYHVEQQVIHEIVKHEMPVMDTASFDAIVGIGAKNADTDCNMSLLCSLDITEFSICLERKSGAPGWLTWGSKLTEAEQKGAVALANIGKSHWALSLKDVLPAGAQLNEERRNAAGVLLCGRGCSAIIDSGTSLIAAPSHAITGLKALLPELASDCSNWNDMPDLEFALNGRTLRLAREAYAMKLSGSQQAKLQVASLLQIQQNMTQVGDACFFSFIAMDRSTEFGPLWIFGMPFFREYHVTFGLNDDWSKRMITLNKASETCTPEPLPDVGTNATWKVADAKVSGPRLYPSIIVAQRGSEVQHVPHVATAPAQAKKARQPMVVHAEDLLADGLLARLEQWKAMEVL